MEFISGGDLFNLIHPLDKNDPSNRTRFDTSPDSYSWKLRMKIAFDIAKGMQYLHNLSPPIVHRDLRSPNIFVLLFSFYYYYYYYFMINFDLFWEVLIIILILLYIE